MLYFYHGQEDYLIELELESLKSKVVDKSFLSTNYRVYDNPKFQELIDILRTPSLMFGNVLAVVNCEKYFFDTKGKINFEDKELKQIEEAIQSMPESLHVVFVCRIERGSTKKSTHEEKSIKSSLKMLQHQNLQSLNLTRKNLPPGFKNRLRKKS